VILTRNIGAPWLWISNRWFSACPCSYQAQFQGFGDVDRAQVAQ
jgi:hypothetical protein